MDKKLTGKKIVVTGGAGFIGSNLIESLLAENNRVICLDNFSTGKRDNIREFEGNPSFSLVEGDIRDYESCLRAAEGADVVFHQAALGSVPRSIKDPVSTVDVNIGGFVKMLFAARESGVKRFVYAASSSTYGDNADLPKVEEKIGKPLSPYAITKYADELFGANFASIYGIEVIGLRYFNVFGKKQDPDGTYAAVIPKFLKHLKNMEPPVINGDGSISRDFTYIENVISANILSAVTEKKEALNQVYNVACGASISLSRMFELIRDLCGKYDQRIYAIQPVYGPERKGDILHSLASVEKAGSLLGYRPLYSAEEGLKRAVDWYWNNL